jgi:hypothetical protein
MSAPEFCRWYPVAEIAERAPAAPGVYQLKIAHGLVDYPRGKSAMVGYGAGPDVRAAALAGVVDPGWLCRHVETASAAAAATLLSELLARFVRRFGAAPAPR